MSEPEELILEGAHFAARLARDAWARHAASPSATALPLIAVRRRLELLLTALFGAAIPIAPLQPPAPRSWLGKLAAGRGRHPSRPDLCGTDGSRVFLAPTLDLETTTEEALRFYRLLAVQQGARLARGTQRVLAPLQSPYVRDLFLLADAAAVDGWIASTVPGLIEDVNRARTAALVARVAALHHPSTPIERAVRTLLGADARDASIDVPAGASPETCAEWAARVAAGSPPVTAYKAMQPVPYWGVPLDPFTVRVSSWVPQAMAEPAERRPPRVSEMRRRPRARTAAEEEDDANAGTWVIRADEPQESVEDPFGLQRPADRDAAADPEGLADSLSDLPEARIVRTPEQPREVLRSGDEPHVPDRSGEVQRIERNGIAYPEWDYRVSAYRRPGAIVRQPPPAPGERAWVEAALNRNSRLVRRVRTRFERLRRRPVRLFRQPEGSDVDISAYVTAAADRLAGVSPGDGLYVATRPARRELAVALLLDVSASTDAWVSTGRRVVDVEKEAMLIVCEALDALGDPYALFAFSGEGPAHVVVPTLKSFADRSSLLVRRRIAALDADGYTRLGGAIRHVSAELLAQRAASRLLLLLSDGKPNDVDLYEGPYGLEDTRQAVAEAHRQGVTVFCLTIDREAPRYAARLFGRSGFAVLHRPEQLPNVVVEVLRALVKW